MREITLAVIFIRCKSVKYDQDGGAFESYGQTFPVNKNRYGRGINKDSFSDVFILQNKYTPNENMALRYLKMV